jgi:hypothetical protein
MPCTLATHSRASFRRSTPHFPPVVDIHTDYRNGADSRLPTKDLQRFETPRMFVRRDNGRDAGLFHGRDAGHGVGGNCFFLRGGDGWYGGTDTDAEVLYAVVRNLCSVLRFARRLPWDKKGYHGIDRQWIVHLVSADSHCRCRCLLFRRTTADARDFGILHVTFAREIGSTALARAPSLDPTHSH